MLRIAGVLVLVVSLYVALPMAEQNAFDKTNLYAVANRQGLYGIITLGVAVLIITGAIDLSIGSVVGLSVVTFGMMMQSGIHLRKVGLPIDIGPIPPYIALFLTLLFGSTIGLVQGLLVTRLKLQAFLVTLCGLFVFRGLARYMSISTVGIEAVKRDHPEFVNPLNQMRQMLVGKNAGEFLEFPNLMVILLCLAVVIGIVLHRSVIGRYWYAIGYNESAARYSGIATERYRLLGFVISSTLASLCGVLLLLDYGNANPTDAGEMWELYAVTGAVLGGCSLRGGEGTIFGIVLGAMVLPLLRNLINFLEIKDAVIPVVIGLTLLFGTIADEFFRRRSIIRK